MGFNIDDLRYNFWVNTIGELTKLCNDDPQDKADIDKSTELGREIRRIFAEVRDSCGTPEQKRAKFVLRLTETLRKFEIPEEEIDNAVKQIINQQL